MTARFYFYHFLTCDLHPLPLSTAHHPFTTIYRDHHPTIAYLSNHPSMSPQTRQL